ncbi:hypothetical protein [Williamsia sterculiae]|uniref:Uncharacterized protein n=1 Tax=Williamsia sterculiae TaxID=1344003 RepID=A0A1N7GQL4_9NOCA|nr:hypothetical protein [Williamsia sterculiae]SIS14897.1 hypothetical protein SAMN05445060_3001 [Williamsia sterculiae]
MANVAERHDTDARRSGASRTPDLLGSIRRIAGITPDRVLTGYGISSVTYRELAATIEQMIPVTRSQQMDDRAAAVAAVFACLPLLGSESSTAVVASVIDRALAQIRHDAVELDSAMVPRTRTLAERTGEIDLRVIANRLSPA